MTTNVLHDRMMQAVYFCCLQPLPCSPVCCCWPLSIP